METIKQATKTLNQITFGKELLAVVVISGMQVWALVSKFI
jgi:hypothetical protein